MSCGEVGKRVDAVIILLSIKMLKFDACPMFVTQKGEYSLQSLTGKQETATSAQTHTASQAGLQRVLAS